LVPRPLAWATLGCPFGANNAVARPIGRGMKMKRCVPNGAVHLANLIEIRAAPTRRNTPIRAASVEGFNPVAD